jgi:hypothetical protein
MKYHSRKIRLYPIFSGANEATYFADVFFSFSFSVLEKLQFGRGNSVIETNKKHGRSLDVKKEALTKYDGKWTEQMVVNCLCVATSLSRWDRDDMVAASYDPRFKSQIDIATLEKRLAVEELSRLCSPCKTTDNHVIFGRKTSSPSLLSCDGYKSEQLGERADPVFGWKLTREPRSLIEEYQHGTCTDARLVASDAKLDNYFSNEIVSFPSRLAMQDECEDFGFTPLFDFTLRNLAENDECITEVNNKSAFHSNEEESIRHAPDFMVCTFNNKYDGPILPERRDVPTPNTTGIISNNIINSTSNRGKRWTSSEDRLLLSAIFAQEKSPYNWKEISKNAFLDSRSPYQVSLD